MLILLLCSVVMTKTKIWQHGRQAGVCRPSHSGLGTSPTVINVTKLNVFITVYEIGGCYGMEMNVEKTKVMRILIQPFPVKIMIE